MKYVVFLSIVALSFLTACETTASMTYCQKGAIALALVEANAPPDSITVKRAQANYLALCPDGPEVIE